MNIEIRNNGPVELIHMIWGPIAILFIATAGIIRNIAPRLPVCIFHQITGLPCPTCGATRSVIALSQFDLGSSFILNPLVPLFGFGLIVFSMLFLVGSVTKKSLKISLTERAKKTVRISVMALFALNWLFLVLVGR